eukprot:6465804-Amphidinium_carterae.5
MKYQANSSELKRFKRNGRETTPGTSGNVPYHQILRRGTVRDEVANSSSPITMVVQTYILVERPILS